MIYYVRAFFGHVKKHVSSPLLVDFYGPMEVTAAVFGYSFFRRIVLLHGLIPNKGQSTCETLLHLSCGNTEFIC